ncbi:hypothetical protein BdWA1_002707 [Babesia duncani]|uniref:Uncharacterized protein n=1 Tax=Babesia duncani TaxID=323732 RepID=A0AAD9UNQ9_9APIC|nr:hypothetical protein BdWA1_002707 [Babesia duncani]
MEILEEGARTDFIPFEVLHCLIKALELFYTCVNDAPVSAVDINCLTSSLSNAIDVVVNSKPSNSDVHNIIIETKSFDAFDAVLKYYGVCSKAPNLVGELRCMVIQKQLEAFYSGKWKLAQLRNNSGQIKASATGPLHNLHGAVATALVIVIAISEHHRLDSNELKELIPKIKVNGLQVSESLCFLLHYCFLQKQPAHIDSFPLDNEYVKVRDCYFNTHVVPTEHSLSAAKFICICWYFIMTNYGTSSASKILPWVIHLGGFLRESEVHQLVETIATIEPSGMFSKFIHLSNIAIMDMSLLIEKTFLKTFSISACTKAPIRMYNRLVTSLYTDAQPKSYTYLESVLDSCLLANKLDLTIDLLESLHLYLPTNTMALVANLETVMQLIYTCLESTTVSALEAGIETSLLLFNKVPHDTQYYSQNVYKRCIGLYQASMGKLEDSALVASNNSPPHLLKRTTIARLEELIALLISGGHIERVDMPPEFQSLLK